MWFRTCHPSRLARGAMPLLALALLLTPVGSAGAQPEALLPAQPAPYCTEVIKNGGFELGTIYWTTSGSPTIISTGGHSGWHSAQLGARNNAADRISQTIACPFSSGTMMVGYYVYMQTDEAAGAGAVDVLTVRLSGSAGGPYTQTYSNSNEEYRWLGSGTVWSVPVACTPGATWEISFQATTNSFYPTWFLVDDVTMSPCCSDDSYEANDSFGTARAVSPGTYIARICPGTDEDWFRFDAAQGQSIRLTLGIAEGGGATVCLNSPAGDQVGGCANAVYPGSAIIDQVATSAGPWRARVYDPGNTTLGQRLNLTIQVSTLPTETPTPTPTPTHTPTVPTTTPIHTPTATPTRTGTAPRALYLPLLIRKHWSCPEPNDSLPSACGPLLSGQTYHEVISSVYDEFDSFYFDLPATHTVDAWLQDIAMGCNYDLYLKDASGRLLKDSANDLAEGEHIHWGPLPAGRYYLVVARIWGWNANLPYTLRVDFQ